VAVAGRHHDATLVPPLKLAETDAREFRYVSGCEGWLQCSRVPKRTFRKMFETS
jgi:hypothetical protein